MDFNKSTSSHSENPVKIFCIGSVLKVTGSKRENPGFSQKSILRSVVAVYRVYLFNAPNGPRDLLLVFRLSSESCFHTMNLEG